MSTLLRSLCTALFGSTVALSLANCSSDKSTGAVHGLATGCLANSDCDKPLICTFKICHRACSESRDCPNVGEHCLNLPEGSVCQLPEDGVSCTYSTECKAPLKCAVDSKCRVACQGDGDCLDTQTCASHVCADNSEIDVRTKDLAHTNPAGGWNGVSDDGGVPRDDGGAGGKSGRGGNSGSGGGPGIGPDGSTTDAGPAPCTGTGLAKFHPSNLPVPLVLPAGLVPLRDSSCNFNTDSSDPADATITTPHWEGFCNSSDPVRTLPSRVITLKDKREAVVLFAESFTLSTGETLSFTGQRPLIIVTTGKIDINGTITATAAKANGWAVGGAPAPSSAGRAGVCPIDTILGGGRSGSTTSSTGIGAGGGAFCGTGGPGSFDPAGAPAPLGGVVYGTPDLMPLVGGSAGGTATAGTGNDVSNGGGAIELVSGTEILIGDAGIINMGGGGAQYGAGAGSGGAILLEAPTVTVKGVLTANGGGGGGPYGTIGQAGQPTDQAATGASADAGKGAAGATANGSAGNAAATGLLLAGGGGGAGRIRINTGCGGDPVIAGTAVISPFESTTCFTKGSLK